MTDQTPVQIAWVTRDLDATEAALTTLLGARKWIRMPDVHFGPDTCEHRGSPADYNADISLSYAGDTQLELIAPTRGESIYTEFLAQSGPGLHHICIEVPDADAFDAALTGGGESTDVVARGVMPGGMRFAYLSAAAAGVPYLEIAYIPDEIRTFFDYVKQEQQ
ncbi:MULTISPECIES: VOC family protein [Mycolicibacterium]|uniref:Lactoylglutathione lyase n=1 Tax=Mycolicibacterium aichiense TaxID=1799 RepID=A0AAD1HNA0_9MYCO|nr:MULTISPECIES: VOC family protein [Mycolicibacterium]MCV7019516.1 VOC family protein [Mycolicibacterium aichiense]BBX08174.1 lactoylglutathione lyase [Mycolicibacterium aichiense]STZ81978.1 putative lactoylglutathione lyase [Mycolicibacterium aichiense]